MDRVTLQVELKGDQEALRKLQQLQQLVNQLNGKKITPTIDSSQADSALGRLGRSIREMFNKDQKLKINDSDIDAASRSVQDLHNRVTALDNDDIDINVNTSGLTSAQGQVASLASALQGLSTMFSTIGGAFTTTGGWLQNISGMVGGNIAGTAMRTAIGYSTVLGIQGLGNSISRFDTFRTFPRMMEAMGFSAEDAQNAINKLNEAVLGTPTALDEIMDLAQDFILLTDDVEKGTNFAIAANNAFLANGSDAQQVYYGMRQLRDLFSKGGLREQEWDSLFSAMGISIGVIGEEMGYTSSQIGEFKAALKSIGTEDEVFGINEFIDAIIRAGTETGKLTTMVDVGKDTMNASLTNIKTAFSNLGATLFQEADSLLLEKYGRGLPDTIKLISEAIKKVAIPGARNWLGDNFDTITKLIEKITSFNWGKLAGSVADNALKFFETLGKIFDFFGEDNVIDFVSFAMVWAGPLGKAMSLLGGVFNMIGGLFRSAGNGLGRLGSGAAGAVATTGYLGLVTELALGFKELAKAGKEISSGDFENLSTNLMKMKDLIIISAEIAAILTGGGTILAAIPTVGWTVGAGEALAAGIIGIIGEIAIVLEKYADVLKKLSDMSDSELPDAEKITNFILVLSAFQNGVNDHLLGSKIDTKSIEALKTCVEIIDFLSKNQDVFNNLDDIHVDFELVSNKVSGMGEGLTSIVQSLLDHFGENGGVRTIQQRGAIVENIGKIIVTLDETTDKLLELKGSLNKMGIRLSEDKLDENSDYAELINTINAFVSGLKSVSDAISDDDLDALFKAIKTKLEDHIIKNYKEMVGTVQELANLTDALDFGELGLLEGNSRFEDLKTQMGVLITGIRDVMTVLDANLADTSTWFQKSKTGNDSDILENLEASMRSVRDLMQATKGSMDAMQGIDFRKLDMLKRNIALVIEMLRGVLGDTQMTDNSSLTQSTTIGMYEEVMKRLSSIILTVSTMTPILRDIADAGTIELLTNMIAGLGIALGQAPEDMDDVVERVATLQVVVTMLGEMVETVSLMQEKMTAIMEENVPEEVGGLLGQLATMIGGFEFGEDVDENDFMVLAESIKIMDEAVTSFMEVTLASLMEKLQELIDRLNELSDPTLVDLTSKMTDAETKTDDLKLAIQGLGEMCDQKKPSVDALTSSIDAATSSAEMAAGSINTLAAAIAQLEDKTVHVSVITEGLENYNPLMSRLTRYPQNGGAIYRAGGGSVFRPRGTDTVPAMLTPGEFVIRKTAVDRIGAPILAMLNRMDISGAIDALMSKVHTPFFGGYVDNRRTYDNHATINQTINTNNPSYTYRRASRFAHAL